MTRLNEIRDNIDFRIKANTPNRDEQWLLARVDELASALLV